MYTVVHVIIIKAKISLELDIGVFQFATDGRQNAPTGKCRPN